MTDLPPSNGHDSLMVVVDHGLMKGVILIPCSKTIDVAGVAKHFLHHVFKCLSLHDSLISNRGPQFTSTFARELAQCKVASKSWGIGESKVVSSKGLEGYEIFDPRDSRKEDREEENA